MTATTHTSPRPLTFRADKASALALRLAHAENALLALTSGQVDSIVDPGGNTYLLRPAQEHLRRKEARLQGLFDSFPDVITVLNEAGEVCYQNPAVTRVLGYDAGALFGRSHFEFVHTDDLPRLERAFFDTIQKVQPTATAEFRHRALDGSWRPLEATLACSQPSGAERVILACRETTLRRLPAAESTPPNAPSAEALIAKDRFLAMLSHELRTPLLPALYGVEELQEDERFAEARPTLKMIRRNLDLESRLLDELIDFTKVGHHKVRLRPESIDAHEAVGSVLETCQGEIRAAQIEVQLDLRASEKMVLADSLRLQQVMWNLVKNAIKFSTPGSSISITSANDTPGGLSLEFVDHGVGIEPEMLPMVFDPFQQGDLQHIYGGLGLGMFIAKGLAEAQQGTLTVASEGPGLGATFRLTLHTATIKPPVGNGTGKHEE